MDRGATEAASPGPLLVLVDADACPVRDEVYRVAARHGARVLLVAAGLVPAPREPWIERLAAGPGLDAADDRIADLCRPGAVVVTADVPLAARALAAGADALAPNGRAFTPNSIGSVLATRDLMASLRANPLAPGVGGGPAPFSPRDRSRFLEALHLALSRRARAGHARAWG